MSFIDDIVKGPDSRNPRAIAQTTQNATAFVHEAFDKIAERTAAGLKTEMQVLGALISANQHRPENLFMIF